MKLLKALGSEFKILMDLPLSEIENSGTPILSEAIEKMRSGDVIKTPGFDGEFGKIKLFPK